MLDLKKMQKKLDDLKKKGGNTNFFKPTEGKQDIRIVPTEDGDPFKSFHFHYGVGQSGFLCPQRNFGDDCPVCAFVKQLFREDDEESREAAKNLMAKQRFLSPIIVRGSESEGVKIWTYSKTVYEELLGLVLNPDYGDITDAETGLDLTLDYGKQPGMKFPSSKITPRRKASPLCKGTDEECAELLKSVPNFDELYQRVGTEEAQKMLDEHLAAAAEGDDSEGTVKYGGEKSALDKAFDDLVEGD